MNQIDNNKPVLVTGANGYVGSWIVKELLENGCTVHATVRDISNQEKIEHLLQLSKNNVGHLKLFVCDLLTEGSFKEAMQDCALVFHTASPFKTDVKDSQKELLEPAINGTQNVLSTVNEVDSVDRVILTSSCAAIYTDASECLNYENNELSENIWNVTASLNNQPYSYSKTLAEKKAWEIHSQQSKWDLVVMNPSFVLGPSLNPKYNTSESYNVLKQIGEGLFKNGIPRLAIGIVDVRDLARAHFKAAYNRNAKGRYIVNAHNTNFFEMTQFLLPKYGLSFPIPSKVAPKWFLWLFGTFFNKALTRSYVSNNVNHSFKANSSKIKKDLEIQFRSMEETIEEAFQSLIDAKIIHSKQ